MRRAGSAVEIAKKKVRDTRRKLREEDDKRRSDAAHDEGDKATRARKGRKRIPLIGEIGKSTSIFNIADSMQGGEIGGEGGRRLDLNEGEEKGGKETPCPVCDAVCGAVCGAV